jgi:hypothetical protein
LINSWLQDARRASAPLAGALLLGVSGTAQADHDRGVRVVVSTPGFYTAFDTGARYRYDDRPYGYYAPPRLVYVPGYWTWAAPPGYWRDGYRDHRWRDDHPHHHGMKRGWDRHARWDDDARHDRHRRDRDD